MALGTDIVEISRIRRIAKEHPGFWQRILTEDEQRYCRSAGDGIHSLAGRFAAKEAVMKALGTGMNALKFNEIEILNDVSGKPCLHPGPVLREMMERQGIDRIEVSISHCRAYATAVAWAQSPGPATNKTIQPKA